MNPKNKLIVSFQFWQSLEWRRLNRVNEILQTWTPPEVIEKYYSIGQTGYDKFGCPRNYIHQSLNNYFDTIQPPVRSFLKFGWAPKGRSTFAALCNRRRKRNWCASWFTSWRRTRSTCDRTRSVARVRASASSPTWNICQCGKWLTDQV